MNCLAIGDFLLPAKAFDDSLKGDPLFGDYRSVNWEQGFHCTRAQFRDVVRRVETMGSRAYDPEKNILDGIEKVEVIFSHLCPLPAELIRRAKKLRFICTARGGLENIDVDAASAAGVTILNCPEHNALAVAEYTIGLIIAETRNIARAHHSLMGGVWQEYFGNTVAIPELNTATIGLIGFGTIGRLVAGRLLPFEAKVLVCDPFVDEATVHQAGCTPVSKEELLRRSDVVSLHGRVPKGEPPLIGKGELSLMKPSAVLINTARAALVDMDALYDALKNRRIMGAALDVFPGEPLRQDDPLLSLDNVTLTNHRGGDTLNSYIKAPELLMKKLRKAAPPMQPNANAVPRRWELSKDLHN